MLRKIRLEPDAAPCQPRVKERSRLSLGDVSALTVVGLFSRRYCKKAIPRSRSSPPKPYRTENSFPCPDFNWNRFSPSG